MFDCMTNGDLLCIPSLDEENFELSSIIDIDDRRGTTPFLISSISMIRLARRCWTFLSNLSGNETTINRLFLPIGLAVLVLKI